MATQVDWLFGTLGIFVVAGTLLGLSGITGVSIEIPQSFSTPTDPGNPQSWGSTILECVLTLPLFDISGFDPSFDCDRETSTGAFDFLDEALGFAYSYGSFFFQLLTFQLPIPTWLNAAMVLPPAIANIYIGIRLARGGG